MQLCYVSALCASQREADFLPSRWHKVSAPKRLGYELEVRSGFAFVVSPWFYGFPEHPHIFFKLFCEWFYIRCFCHHLRVFYIQSLYLPGGCLYFVSVVPCSAVKATGIPLQHEAWPRSTTVSLLDHFFLKQAATSELSSFSMRSKILLSRKFFFSFFRNACLASSKHYDSSSSSEELTHRGKVQSLQVTATNNRPKFLLNLIDDILHTDKSKYLTGSTGGSARLNNVKTLQQYRFRNKRF